MNFVHDDSDWAALLAIVSENTGRQIGMVEKDYWVTHTLWAIHEQGFEVWFKGGTSLSKGFGLIERFSEDIDVRIDSGTVAGLGDPKLSWKNEKLGVEERDTWFAALGETMDIPSCTVTRNPSGSDARARSAWFEVAYPSLHAGSLPQDMRQFVLLEVGRARVIPFVSVDLSSWVHHHLARERLLGDFRNNRPKQVRCIHPWVTCLEKVDAIVKRFERGTAASTFVRHYEDAARILSRRSSLPNLDSTLGELIDRLAERDGTRMPSSRHAAFNPVEGDGRWQGVQEAWAAISPMFWGDRLSLEDATVIIRDFLTGIDQTKTSL